MLVHAVHVLCASQALQRCQREASINTPSFSPAHIYALTVCACSEHTQALKRLQREAFEQLVGVNSRVDSLQEHAEEQIKAAHPTLLPVGVPQHAEHNRPRVFMCGEVVSSLTASNVQVLPLTCPATCTGNL